MALQAILLLLTLFPSPGFSAQQADALDGRVERIVELSVNAPWEESQARIEALRPRFDELTSRQRNRLLLVEARNLMIAGEPDSGLEQTLAVLEVADTVEIRLRALVLASNAAGYIEHYEDAFRYLHSALSLLSGVDRPDLHADVFGRASYLYARVQQYDQALQFAERAVSAGRRSDDPRDLCAELVQYANALYRHPQQDATAYGTAVNEADVACRETADPLYRAVVESMKGQVLIEKGEYQQAVSQLRDSLAQVREIDYTAGTNEARLYLMEALVRAGDLVVARGIGQELAPDFAANERWREVAETRELLVQVAELLGDFETAFNESREADTARRREYDDAAAIELAFQQARFENRLRGFDAEIKQQQTSTEALRRNSAISASALIVFIGLLLIHRRRTSNRLNKIIRQRNRELYAIGSIARQVNQTLSGPDLLARFLGECVNQLPVLCGGQILIRDWFRGDLIPVASLNMPTAESRGEFSPEMFVKPGGSDSNYGVVVASSPELTGDGFWEIDIVMDVNGEIDGLVRFLVKETDWQEVDRDTLRRLRVHAMSALSRARQVDDYMSERDRAGEAMSSLRQTQSELRVALQSTQTALDRKSDFVGRMSHALRTPLHTMSGLSQHLVKEFQRVTRRGASEYSAQIHKAAQHLETLVDDLTREGSETEHPHVVQERIELHSLVDDVAGMVRPLVENAGNRLVVDIDTPVTYIFSEPLKLRQILINLLSNAARHTDDGCIEVLVDVPSVKDHAAGHSLRIRVRDDGVGIKRSDLKRIFEAYRQVDGDVGLTPRGSGLGLAVTRSLCEIIGGDIAVESEPGVGSTFTVMLPCEWSGDAGAYREEIRSSERTRPTVLVVEDDPVNLELMVEYFGSEEFAVTGVGSSEEALDAMKGALPDLVLTDMNLPGMSGEELIKKLKSSGGARAHIPVIAVSAYTDDRVRSRAMQIGVTEYWVKPVDMERLVSRVKSMLSPRSH